MGLQQVSAIVLATLLSFLLTCPVLEVSAVGRVEDVDKRAALRRKTARIKGIAVRQVKNGVEQRFLMRKTKKSLGALATAKETQQDIFDFASSVDQDFDQMQGAISNLTILAKKEFDLSQGALDDIAANVNLKSNQTQAALDNIAGSVERLCGQSANPINDSTTDNIITLDGDHLFICRVDSRTGFGKKEDDLDYMASSPFFSSMTRTVADVRTTALLSTLNFGKDIGTVILTAAGFSIAASGLAIAGSVMQLLSQSAAKSETSLATATAMNNFKATTMQIAILAEKVDQGFAAVRRDIADSSLDTLMSSLQAIQSAFVNFNATLDENNPKLTRTYTANFREACNAAHRTPADIFRDLYGYACGNETTNRNCENTEGDATGVCKFGVKKRNYVLDLFSSDAAGDITRFRDFSEWLKSALLLAEYLYGVCLPADQASCTDPEEDPIFNKALEDMVAAFEEVQGNLNQTEACFRALWKENIGVSNYFQIGSPGTCLGEVGKCVEEDGRLTPKSAECNQCMVDRIADALVTKDQYKDFHFQVIVYNFDEQFASNNDNYAIRAPEEDQSDVAGRVYMRPKTDSWFGKPFLADKVLHIRYHSREAVRSDEIENLVTAYKSRDCLCGDPPFDVTWQFCEIAQYFWATKELAESECPAAGITNSCSSRRNDCFRRGGNEAKLAAGAGYVIFRNDVFELAKLASKITNSSSYFRVHDFDWDGSEHQFRVYY